METFELRYFIGVAATENIHQASEKLNVSPGSLSKAIARLEDELNVKLFSREGRGIQLTEEGRLLQRRASEILHLEQAAKLELSGVKGTVKVIITGQELLLGKMAVEQCLLIKAAYPLAQFEFQTADDETAMERVARGDAHIAIITSDISNKAELRSKVIGETKFLTYLGKGHPLAKKKTVHVSELLKHSFVSPSHPMLGKVGSKQSMDGWRDDEFPRKIDFVTSSLKTLEELVINGHAIAYLPDYLGNDLAASVIKVEGCPYSCLQKIKLVARKAKGLRWLDDLFSQGD